MKTDAFKKWLEDNGYPSNTLQSRLSNCRTVENYEGDLDEHFIKDEGFSLMKRLSYSRADERNNQPAKHKIPIDGNIRNGSATLKQAVNLYMRVRSEQDAELKTNIASTSADKDDLTTEIYNNFSYEKDLKAAMVSQIKELFPGYDIYGEDKEGIEYYIGGKRIDILLEKNNGDLLAVELKSGTANYRAFGQLSMYLGLLMDEFPDKEIKGCIVAGKIDDSLKSATKTTELVSLRTYRMRLELKEDIIRQ